MKNFETETKKLEKMISVRMTTEDYRVLKNISQNSGKNISNTLRSIACIVIEIMKNNNKSKMSSIGQDFKHRAI